MPLRLTVPIFNKKITMEKKLANFPLLRSRLAHPYHSLTSDYQGSLYTWGHIVTHTSYSLLH